MKDAEESVSGVERERVYRLRKTCESGLVDIELSEREDALENAILAARVTYRGEELPSARRRRSSPSFRSTEDREELGELQEDASPASTTIAWSCSRPGRLDAELSGWPNAVSRNDEEKGISLRDLSRVLQDASRDADEVYGQLSSRWFDNCSAASG